MNTIPMEALGRQVYNGKTYILGQTIPVLTEQDASDMTALRLARRLPALMTPPPAAPAEKVVERDMDAKDAPEAEQNTSEPNPPARTYAATSPKKDNRRYNHREMRVQR